MLSTIFFTELTWPSANLVIAVIQDVTEVCVEGMDIIDAWEFSEYLAELLIVRGLTELDLAHVEVADACDFEARMDDSGSLPIRLGQDNVDELLGIRNYLELLELVHIHDPSVPLVARLIQEVDLGFSQSLELELDP